jgi:hypothetical protein
MNEIETGRKEIGYERCGVDSLSSSLIDSKTL